MILWRDRDEKKKAAAAFKPDAFHCYELGVVDGIVTEPRGGAQKTPMRPPRRCGRRSSIRSRRSRVPLPRSCAAPAGRSSARWASSAEAPLLAGFSTSSTGFSTEY